MVVVVEEVAVEEEVVVVEEGTLKTAVVVVVVKVVGPSVMMRSSVLAVMSQGAKAVQQQCPFLEYEWTLFVAAGVDALHAA